MRSLGRGVAQPGSALAWGARGRKFESCRPDQLDQALAIGGTLCPSEALEPLPKDAEDTHPFQKYMDGTTARAIETVPPDAEGGRRALRCPRAT